MLTFMFFPWPLSLIKQLDAVSNYRKHYFPANKDRFQKHKLKINGKLFFFNDTKNTKKKMYVRLIYAEVTVKTKANSDTL